jgi:hypothetical protein
MIASFVAIMPTRRRRRQAPALERLAEMITVPRPPQRRESRRPECSLIDLETMSRADSSNDRPIVVDRLIDDIDRAASRAGGSTDGCDLISTSKGKGAD